MRLPSEEIDYKQWDHITDPSPEEYEAIKVAVRRLEVEVKTKEILAPILQPFQNENDQKECARNVSREFHAYMFNIEGVDPDFFAQRYTIGLAVLEKYWPAAYQKSINDLARYVVNDLKGSSEYGYACLAAFTAEEQRLKQGNFFPLGNGRYLTGIGELVAILAERAIQRATEAAEQIRPIVRWITDEFILRETGKNLIMHSESLPAEILQEIKSLRETILLKEIPAIVVSSLITHNWERLPICYLLNPLAAMVGVEAYCEGAALAYCLYDNQFDSTETAHVVRSYYLARRLGAANTAEGSAYILAIIQSQRFPWWKFSLLDSDRELLKDEFVDSFKRVFADRPVESMLNPKLCFGYALQSAENAVKRLLSKIPKTVSIDEQNIELWVSPSDDELVYVQAETPTPEQKKLPDVIKLLPNYDPYLRYQNREVSLRKLATEQNRSHEAVRKRLKGFESSAKENLRLHEEADLAGWPLISAEVWAQITPLIPQPRNRDWYIMRGIAFKMSKGISWAKLPTGETFRRYYQKWLEAGVFELMHQAGIDLW